MANNARRVESVNNECFVIMPISNTDGYDNNHFLRVYEDILKPACKRAGYEPVRADDVKQTNLIHLDILQKLLSSSMAVCDLSSRNPNVLFELGLRQAFDKPTVIVQDIGTPKIFDIAPLRYTEYRRELKYREVIEDQESIAKAIEATRDAVADGTSVNSIVKILSLSSPASLEDTSRSDPAGMMQLLRAEISELRSEFRRGLASKTSAPVLKTKLAVDDGGAEKTLHRTRSRMVQIEELIKIAAPSNVVLGEISAVQKDLSAYMGSETPPWFREEAMHLFARCEDLEQKILVG